MSMSPWSDNEMLTPALASESIVVTREEGCGRISNIMEKERGTFVKRIRSKGR